MAESSRPGVVALISAVLNEAAELFQTEIRLVRAEISENVSRLTGSAGFIAGGAIAALASLFLLLQSAVRWLAVAGLPDQWGFLLVGIVVGVIAIALLMKGLNSLKAASLVPDRAVEQFKADLSTIKEHV